MYMNAVLKTILVALEAYYKIVLFIFEILYSL
jgi:hypothetical protein